MAPKRPRIEEDESPSGLHRRLEDGSMVEVTSPRQATVSASGIHVPWHFIVSGGIALFGFGAGGSSILDQGHEDCATKAEVQKLQADVADLHRDIDSVSKILDQIVTTKFIIKESAP
jgi:hypothetical protein